MCCHQCNATLVLPGKVLSQKTNGQAFSQIFSEQPCWYPHETPSFFAAWSLKEGRGNVSLGQEYHSWASGTRE